MEKRKGKQKEQNNRKHNNRKMKNHPPSPAKILTIYVDFLCEILCVIC